MICISMIGEGHRASAALTLYSPNPRYLANGGEPVVILGAGQPLPGHKTQDYRAYLDTMASHKVNYGRVWHLLVWDAKNAYFPWARDGGGTAKDGLQKFDLTHWDSNFWTRLKDACAYAQSKNIYLGIMFFDECGLETPTSSSDHRWDWHPFNPANNVNGLSLPTSGDCLPEFYSLSNSKLKSLQEQYVSKLISETNGYPNVIYEICNEYAGPEDWEKYWIDYVSARCSNILSVNRLGSIPSWYWSDADVDMVKFHWGTTNASTTNSNMNSYYSKNKAINYDETPETSSITYNSYRKMLWGAFVGGGHIHLENGYNEGASYDAVLRAVNFIQDNGVRFWEMKPSNSLVTRTPGGSAYTLAKSGSEYVTYLVGSGGGSMTISLASGVTYTAKAYNPSTGAYTNLTVSGSTVSGIPSYSADIVIYVKAVGGPITTTPNISLTLAVDKTEALPGDTLTYTITYRNTGDGNANSVTVTSPLPANTTYVVGSGGAYDAAARTVVWNVPTIAPGASGMLTFKATVD
jgi:uncharacterized repeat protein (TIGR01451 family)